MTVKIFENKCTGSANEDIMNSLTKQERDLARSLDLIKVTGKRGRHVPIILTRQMKTAMELLKNKI